MTATSQIRRSLSYGHINTERKYMSAHYNVYKKTTSNTKCNSRYWGPCVICLFRRRRQPRKTFTGTTAHWHNSEKSSSYDPTTSVRRQSTNPSGDDNGTKVYSSRDAAEAAASNKQRRRDSSSSQVRSISSRVDSHDLLSFPTCFEELLSRIDPRLVSDISRLVSNSSQLVCLTNDHKILTHTVAKQFSILIQSENCVARYLKSTN